MSSQWHTGGSNAPEVRIRFTGDGLCGWGRVSAHRDGIRVLTATAHLFGEQGRHHSANCLECVSDDQCIVAIERSGNDEVRESDPGGLSVEPSSWI